MNSERLFFMKAKNQKRDRGILKLHTVRTRIISLLRTPLFWVITFFGNTFIGVGSCIFHFVEKNQNSNIKSFLDSLSWAVGIVTTVGTDISPVTTAGKIIGIFMMMGGAVFLWSYMALFVGALVDPELKYIEREVSEIQQEVRQDAREELLLFQKIKKLTDEYESRLEQQKPKENGS